MTNHRAHAGASLAGVAVAVLGLSVVVLAVLAGSAPARLASAMPGEGARLVAPPADVVLTFTGQLDAGRAHASVVGPAGATVVSGAPKVDGAMLRLPMETTRPGRYLTGYHVTFEDGREASGQVAFTVDTGSPAAARDAGYSGDAAGGAPVAAGHQHGRVDPVTLVVVGADALALAVLLTVLMRRTVRR